MSEINEWRRRSRLEVLYALDVLMHHLSDGCTTGEWVSDVVPESLYKGVPGSELDRYDAEICSGATDPDDFGRAVEVAIKALHDAAFRVHYERGALS